MCIYSIYIHIYTELCLFWFKFWRFAKYTFPFDPWSELCSSRKMKIEAQNVDSAAALWLGADLLPALQYPC